MYVVGIIAEYNPFHQGHLSQFAWIKEKLGPETRLVVALASYFCQRGCPGLQSPRQRARAALAAGADLVILLPQYFSSSAGESYAQAGVSLLAASDLVKTQAASAEFSSKKLLEEAAQLISPESPELKARIKDLVHEGLPPHQARAQALLQQGADPKLVEVFNQPNSRLCVEYLAARSALPPTWHKPGFFLCPRQEGSLGASSLRALIEEQALKQRQQAVWQAPWLQLTNSEAPAPSPLLQLPLLESLKNSMPQASLALLLRDLQQGHFALQADFLDLARLALTRISEAKALTSYRDMGGGLAERLLSKLDAQNFLEAVSARNFPPGRIQRALTSYLLGIDQALRDQAGKLPAFILPLAFNRDGRYILRKMQERAQLPVFSRFSDTGRSTDPAVQSQALIERRAAALWAYFTGQSQLEGELLEPPFQA
ncbi:MAG: nucleotidyltransferase family protein [Eubacteriales bacterium]|nr:nucleotidyltransferase family protein [Eubacteriales bacterium]